MKNSRMWHIIAHTMCVFFLFLFVDSRAEALSPEAYTNFMSQVNALEKKNSLLPAATRKLQGGLSDIALSDETVQKLQPSSLNEVTERKEYQITCAVSDRLIELIGAIGGEVLCKSVNDNVIVAGLPISSLLEIASDADVWNIYPVEKAMPNGTVSEGVVAHRVNDVRSKYGFTGKDIKVGVISDSADTCVIGDVSYTGLVKALQENGDLPQNVTIVGDTYASGEGSGMMEIVYNMAPNAKLYFKNGRNTEIGFADDIAQLIAKGCSIIVDDLTLFQESAFESGPIGRQIKKFVDNGGIYFSSAANSGALDRGTSCTWEGDFCEGESASGYGTSGTIHNFGSEKANLITSINRNCPYIKLWWSDPWGNSSNDYNLYVIDANGNIICKSESPQTGVGCYPFEYIVLTSAQTAKISSGLYVVVVKKSGAQKRYLRLETPRGRFKIATCGSTYGHNAGEYTISCAAASASGLNRPFKSSDPLEEYSSDGPRRIFYDYSGNAITSGNLLSTGGRALQKPDFTAADKTLSSWTKTIGIGNSFGGTSAAAPHAAAIAALMLEANPNLVQADIIEIFKKATFSGSNAIWNRNYGYGIIDAYTAVQLAKDGVAKTITVSPNNQTFTYQASKGSFLVEAVSAWMASASDYWITLNTTSGSGNGTLSYTLSTNTGTQERSGTITVTCGSDKAVFTIRQSAESARLNVSPDTADFSDAADNGQFSISANYSWTATTSDSWITLNTTSGSGDGTVLYSVEANTGSLRTGTITVKSGSLTATHTVTQLAPPQLSLDPYGINPTADAANGAFRVISDSMWTVTKSESWITLGSTTSGTGNGTVSYSITENKGKSRNGWIYVTCGTVRRTYLIAQRQRESIQFSSESADIPASGGTGSFTITTTGNQVLALNYSQEDWVRWTFDKNEVDDGRVYTCTYTVDPNPNPLRTRTVNISVTFNGIDCVFTIRQGVVASNYLVTYRPGMFGSGNETCDVKSVGVALTLRGAIFTRNGYTQKGWSTVDGGGKVYDLGCAYAPDASITLYPYWEVGSSDSDTWHIITFAPGLYGQGNYQIATKFKGKVLTLPGVLFTRDGYDQTGWSTTWEGSQKAYELYGTYTTDTETKLYPYWERRVEEEVSIDIGFYRQSGWNQPVCISTTNLVYWAYAPNYVFGQGDDVVLNYLVKNYSNVDATLVDRGMALYDINDNLIASYIESIPDSISAGTGMLFPNRNLSKWLPSLAPGNYVLKVKLDPYDKLNDQNVNNNLWDEWFAVKADGITFNEALDCDNLSFFLDSANAEVFAQTSDSVSGGSCVQFGPQATNSMDSVLWVQVTGPGTLTFKWKATSQDYCAFLGLYVDGELETWEWGTQDAQWKEASVTIESGTHWVCWGLGTYEPSTYYLSAGWVDSVSWRGSSNATPEFTVDGRGVLTGVKLNGATNVEIPSMVNSIAVRSIGAYAITNTTISSVTIPNTVTNIEKFAFYNNSRLSGITIPGSVVSIGESAFNACSNMKSIVLEDGVKNIGNYVFYNCGSLMTVVIPASVNSIAQSILGNCANLKNIAVASGNARYEVRNNALVDKSAQTLLQYPSGRTEREYAIPEGIVNVGYDAFDTVSSLESVIVPESVAELRDFAFYKCSNLASLTFKGNAPSKIGSNVFLGVPTTCIVKVSPVSSGWGVSIPGTWHGLPIQYSYDIMQFDVSYVPGANGIGEVVADIKPYGVTLSLKEAIFTRKGYAQTGWAVSDGGIKAYELGASYDANAAVTLYPYWTANTFDVSYDLNGGVAGASMPTVATYGSAFCVPAPSREGYSFIGWMVTNGLDITTARYGESSTSLPNAIDNECLRCFNGSNVDVWFVDLTPNPKGKVVLAATWESLPDDSRDIGFYSLGSYGWDAPVFLSSTNVAYLAYAPESQFRWGMNIRLSFMAMNWSRVGSAKLQSFLLTIADEKGNVFDEGETGVLTTLGAFGCQECRNVSLKSYLHGITPGRYKLTLELDPNKLINDPDRSNNITSLWFTVTAPVDAIPELPSDATRADVKVALSGSIDPRLFENIQTTTDYDAYRNWALSATGANGTTVGTAAVKASDKAWFSFAVDSSALVEKTIAKEDVKIEDFALSLDDGRFDFTVSIDGVKIGSAALQERLKTVFGIESAMELSETSFSAENLMLDVALPENGSVKLSAKPTPNKTSDYGTSDALFMRVRVMQ